MAVKHSHDPKYFYGGLWSGNFYPALRQLGHEIVESQVDLLPASRFMHIADGFTREEKVVRAEITQKIINEVQEAHQKKPVDLFLSYFYNAHFDPRGFDEIHRLGIPTVNFYCNSIYQFKFVEAIARKVNFAWHAEKDARPLYLKVGANPVWVQMGADPNVYSPFPGILRKPKACFVGQRYADRDRLAATLIENYVPLDIFGPGWNSTSSNGASVETQEGVYLGRKVLRPGSMESYLETVRQNIDDGGILGGLKRTLWQWQYRADSRRLDKILAQVSRSFRFIQEIIGQYDVVLNFSNVWADGRPGSKLIPHVRLRDFEAPMCRTCYLTGHTDEIAEFYETGKEIDTYRNPEELVEKTKFYLAHPEEAERLRAAGYERARRDHTWTNRFQQLFGIMGL